ncbi:MAG TPA: hypothetical protein PKC28_10225 [Bdellovibrionales bacterium]|nr:hypothetical protein [Bdellovibrionales bacterium]
MQSPDLLAVFLGPLEKNGIPYFVTGSIASIFYGEPRLTHDVDIVVHLSQDHLSKFSAFFSSDKFYCPPEEVIQIENKRRPFGHFNLIHHESGFKADIYPDAGDKLHQWAFQNRRHIAFGAISIWIAPPEYVIIRKLEYFREGGSEKHLEDIRKMLLQVESTLDKTFLEKEIQSRGLAQYWERVAKK